MSRLVFSIPQADRLKLRELLDPKQVRQAEFQAVNRTTNALARIVRKGVQDEVKITKKYVDRVIYTRKAKGDPPEGSIEISQRLLPLIAYGGRASKRSGVTVQISKHKPPLRLRHAFKATVRTAGADGIHDGHLGYFTRGRNLPTKGPNVGNTKVTGKLTPKGFAGRLTIIERFGPSILDVVEIPKVLDRIVFDADAELHKNLMSQIDRFTKAPAAT